MDSAAQLLALEIPFRLDLADDADVHSGLRPGHQDLQHRVVGELGVVDEELPPRRANEAGEPVARVFGADDEALMAGRVGLAVEVGLEQLGRLLHEALVRS